LLFVAEGIGIEFKKESSSFPLVLGGNPIPSFKKNLRLIVDARYEHAGMTVTRTLSFPRIFLDVRYEYAGMTITKTLSFPRDPSGIPVHMPQGMGFLFLDARFEHAGTTISLSQTDPFFFEKYNTIRPWPIRKTFWNCAA
jgi:hypothetical protein